ncbi:MAG: hypothetical protein MJ244_06750, partial [Clostridia bacterium]|nr:hypothetical protein [Clostridia bacterium]
DIDFDDEKQFESEFENLFRFCTKMVDYTRGEIVDAVVYSYLCDGFIVKRTGDNKYLITLAEDEEFDKELIYENLIGLTDEDIEIFKLRYGLYDKHYSVSEIANKMNATETHVKLAIRNFVVITKYARSHRLFIR